MRTANSPITIAPQKTALLIVDMQNIWLSEPLNPHGPGHVAEAALLKYAIPAARKAGIQIIWLNWGITDSDFESLPPNTIRIFSFHLEGNSRKKGIGTDIGPVELRNGTTVEGGRLLMRGQWNTALHDPLEPVYQDGLEASPPDRLFHKNRISGMCEAMTECTDFLRRGGFKTLLFTGINTDVCVAATLQDANLRGFDTVLLKDGCGTTNGEAAAEVIERNCKRAWGFLSTCEDLETGVENMVVQ